jgi:hypothetical protein
LTNALKEVPMSRLIGPRGLVADTRRDAATAAPRTRPGRPLAATLVASLVLTLAACASTPMPVEDLAVARAAVANAVSAGADEFAPSELNMSRDKLARADKAVADDEAEIARSLAQQALADAQVATAKARTAKAQRTATALQADSRALQEEMNRKAPATQTPLVPSPTTPRN